MRNKEGELGKMMESRIMRNRVEGDKDTRNTRNTLTETVNCTLRGFGLQTPAAAVADNQPRLIPAD